MAEKVITPNQSLAPFLGQRLNFVMGLDPLAQQNASEATFAMLLPGLNNVTRRIRYYSFYCWLLDMYSKQSGSTNPKHQQQFIRRAEYIIALAAQLTGTEALGIPGSFYAVRQITGDPTSIHDLQAGTYKPNGDTENTYWQYYMGAFGQYYLGSIRNIGIVMQRNGEDAVYIRTPQPKADEWVSGEALAKAFDENLNTEAKRLFLDGLEKGRISEASLQLLLPGFDLTKVPPDTQEDALLLRMILQSDFPHMLVNEQATHRRTTIKHLLLYFNGETIVPNDRSFIYYCYQNKGIGTSGPNETLKAWYYYQFNDYWQYANLAMLHGILTWLEDESGPQWMSFDKLLQSVVAGVTMQINTLQPDLEIALTLADFIDLLEKDEWEYQRLLEKTNGLELITYGFLLFLSLYKQQYENLEELKKLTSQHALNRNGDAPSYFLSEFKAKLGWPLKDFMEDYLKRHIIQRHQMVALQKIGNGIQSTQKFILEDGYIRALGNFAPAFTGPRIGNLIAFLNDLHILNADYSLTEKGIDLLEQLDNANP